MKDIDKLIDQAKEFARKHEEIRDEILNNPDMPQELKDIIIKNRIPDDNVIDLSGGKGIKRIDPDTLEYQEVYILDNKEVNTSLPSSELSDIDSLKYFFQKYLFSVENGNPSQNGATILKMWIDIIQQRNNRSL